jgi:hypothetical protein
MIFREPISWNDALQAQAVKTILPTTLNSAQYRALGAAKLSQATFMAAVEKAHLLDQLGGVVMDALAGTRTTSQQQSFLRLFVQAQDAPESFPSTGRTDFAVRTALECAAGQAQFIAANSDGALGAMPAWEFLRIEDRQEPRNWDGTGGEADKEAPGGAMGSRWMQACQAAGDADAAKAFQDTGRMVALKSSDVWSVLGDLWDDSIGNDWDPVCWNTGMGRVDLPRDEAIELGLMDDSDTAEPADMTDVVKPDMTVSGEFRDQRFVNLLLDLFDTLTFNDGVLTFK